MTELDPAAAPAVDTSTGPTRRQVLVTGGVVAAAVAVTAACGSSGGTSVPGAGGNTVATGDIPVGGGVVLESKQVVVTQPTAGTFKAFSAVCTHEGCLVTKVANGTISCPCHNGQFSATDGSVQGGPPPAPLSEAKFTLSGSTITID
jgi:nitrite reductase/ring-hydroxylating ferredoxin subunit